MEDELNYLSREIMFLEDNIIDLERHRDVSPNMSSHYQGRIDHAKNKIRLLNNIINYITEKELTL